MNPWTLFERGTKTEALEATGAILAAANADAVQSTIVAALAGVGDSARVLIRGSFVGDDAGRAKMFLDVQVIG